MEVNLVLFKKSGTQKRFPLPSKVTVIGRKRDCDLRIPLMSVSKRHCQLLHNDGALQLRDLGSRNGTILNGKAVKKANLKPGDSITIGPLSFVLQIDGEPKSPKPFKMVSKLAKSAAKKAAPPEDTEILDQVDDLNDLDSLDSAEFDSLLDELDPNE